MYLKQNLFTIILILISLSLGIVFIFVNPAVLISIFIFIIATLLILMGINFLVMSNQYSESDRNKLIIQSIVLITIGIALFLIPKGINEWIFRVIIGVVFILYPLLNLFTVQYKKEQFKKDLPMYLTGIILVLSFGAIIKIIMIIIGSALIAFAFVLAYLLYKNRNNTTSPNLIFNIVLKYFIRKGSNNKWE